MIPSLPQKDSRTILFEPTDTIVRYGSGYIRVHVQKEIPKSHINCTGEKSPAICKNKLER